MPSFPGIARVDLSVTRMNAAPKACPERIEGRQHFDDRVGRSQSVWPHEPTVLRAGGPGPRAIRYGVKNPLRERLNGLRRSPAAADNSFRRSSRTPELSWIVRPFQSCRRVPWSASAGALSITGFQPEKSNTFAPPADRFGF